MAMPEIGGPIRTKMHNPLLGVVAGILVLPIALIGACIAIPSFLIMRWLHLLREHSFHRLMKARGRLIAWQDFLRAMRGAGGTCIEERFSPKGPIRFWWTPDNVFLESPHEIIDWFTMRKGRRGVPFVRWCRDRYTNPDGGSAILVETAGVPNRDIYAVWSECRSQATRSRWIEVAPPEILPQRPAA